MAVFLPVILRTISDYFKSDQKYYYPHDLQRDEYLNEQKKVDDIHSQSQEEPAQGPGVSGIRRPRALSSGPARRSPTTWAAAGAPPRKRYRSCWPIAVTFAARCAASGGKAGRPSGIRMTSGASRCRLTISRTVVDGVRCFRPAITLFGGEPLLYKDIIGALEIIKGARPPDKYRHQRDAPFPTRRRPRASGPGRDHLFPGRPARGPRPGKEQDGGLCGCGRRISAAGRGQEKSITPAGPWSTSTARSSISTTDRWTRPSIRPGRSAPRRSRFTT